MANSTYDRWFGVSVKKTNPKQNTMKTTKMKAVKKGPSVIQQFEKVEDTNDDMNVELKKLKRMIKTSKSSPRKFKRG